MVDECFMMRTALLQPHIVGLLRADDTELAGESENVFRIVDVHMHFRLAFAAAHYEARADGAESFAQMA